MTESSDEVRVFQPVVEYDKEVDLFSSKSKIEITAKKPLFIMGTIFVKCEANIYNLWKKIVVSHVRDEKPSLASMLGSTTQSVSRSFFGKENCAYFMIFFLNLFLLYLFTFSDVFKSGCVEKTIPPTSKTILFIAVIFHLR